jgi:hypothetical protein
MVSVAARASVEISRYWGGAAQAMAVPSAHRKDPWPGSGAGNHW